MLGGHNNNSVLPISFGENHFRVGCLGGPINHMGNDHTTAMERPGKRGRATDFISKQQKHQLSLNNNFHQCEAGQLGSILDPNFVSIGLKLSSEEEEQERNSPVSHASDPKTTILPVMLSLGDSLKAEMDRQKEEFDHHMRLQEESMIKSIREVGQRHTISFLHAVEAGIGKKLLEKELEIQNMNRRNNELVEKIKQIGSEVQSWQYRAKYNESVVNALKSNLKQVMAQGIIHGKEGCGDSEVDDAASYANQNLKNAVEANASSFKRQITCRACRAKESSMLLLPCRHLCLCRDCAGFTEACPVCQITKTAGVEVFMS
ncbi:probable BOI-related E3 ubiquitin-protein ligase 2 isoform X2 [Jatropha curcas]|uniref:probable BOI-related E3 ubiquitin-protein ligase 2 isoform X2 n=1 Tax=Jatropha curcas TaxID=180498 RepID=UPI0009D78DF6|nr:probable BOI-related E3 ubiquitin-protein ligase 2 isoform X2 [Jatropha curcas]